MLRALFGAPPRGYAALMRLPPRLLFLALLPAAGAAHAQVHRCTTDAGATIYTDRRCSDIGATERPADAAPAPRSGYRGGCPRQLQDLVYELGSALENHDPNRLAGLYLWTGMSSDRAYRILGRLDVIAKRPLVDIVPVMPAGPDGSDGTLYPQQSVRRQPVALRIEQTLANGITPSHTVFGLQRHFGCWWIRG